MNDRVLWGTSHGILLLLLLTVTAFLSGHWVIILALGPAVYLLVLNANSSEAAPTNIAITYIAALTIGWAAHMAVAPGIGLTSINPISDSGFRLVLSAIIAFGGTMGIMYTLTTPNPMAFVATFTTAIGGLTTIQSLIVAIITVLVMSGVQAVHRRYGPDFSMESDPIDDHSF